MTEILIFQSGHESYTLTFKLVKPYLAESCYACLGDLHYGDYVVVYVLISELSAPPPTGVQKLINILNDSFSVPVAALSRTG